MRADPRHGALCALLAGLLAAPLAALELRIATPPPLPAGAEAHYAPVGEPGLEYSWDFGDGGPRSDFAPAAPTRHVFSAPGHYPVLLRARRDGRVDARSFVQVVHAPLTARPRAWSRSIAFDQARDRVWVVNPDHGSLAAVAADGLARLCEQPAGRQPRSLALAADGTVWVACQDDDLVSVHAGERGERIATIALPYGSRPWGVVFAPDGRSAWVTLAGSGRVARIDARTRAVLATAPACPGARGLAIDGEGRRLLVSRFISGDEGGEVVELDAATLAPVRILALGVDPGPDTPEDGRGLPNQLGAPAISPDGTCALVPAVKANTGRGLARDGVKMNAENTVRAIVARLDLGRGAEDFARRLDLDNRNGITAICFSPVGDLCFIACQGNDLVEILDAYDGSRQAVIRDVGAAPQGVVLDPAGRRLFVHNFLSRTIAAFDVSGIVDHTTNEALPLGVVATVAAETLDAAVLRGKRLFHHAEDSRISFDGYISCAACHLDGGHDGRTWDFTDRGEGLRNTTTLLGRRGTGHGRLHWSANFDEIQDFEHDIRNAFGGSGLMDDADFHAGGRDATLGLRKAGISDDLDDLAAYVGSLDRYGRSPHRAADGALTSEGAAGRALFARQACIACHGGRDFTDSAHGLLHDVGTITATSGTRLGGRPLLGIDTPTLRGLWETAPYLHDGSAATLRDVLVARDPSGRHAGLAGLDEARLAELVAYLLQLDDAEHAAPDAQPLVAIADAPGAPVAAGGIVRLRAILAPIAVAPTAVELLQGDQPVASADAPPWRVAWTAPAAPGEHALVLRARFPSGATSCSAPIIVRVAPAP